MKRTERMIGMEQKKRKSEGRYFGDYSNKYGESFDIYQKIKTHVGRQKRCAMDQEILFQEIDRALLILERPSVYLNTLLTVKEFQIPPYEEIFLLSKTEQSSRHHPEGNAWVHTLMVVDEAAKVKEKSSNPQWFMWAAFLHDVGKIVTTKLRKGQITSHNHDTAGEEIAKRFLESFHFEREGILYITALVRFHMHILYVNKNMQYGDIARMKEKANKKDLALLGWCDRVGRKNANREEVRKIIDDFYDKI